jgi:hypothetical protein
VPTITFGVLCCFFVISHDRRRILPLTGAFQRPQVWELRAVSLTLLPVTTGAFVPVNTYSYS